MKRAGLCIKKKKKLSRRCFKAQKDCRGFTRLLCPVITCRAGLMWSLSSLSLHNCWNVSVLKKHVHKCRPWNNEARLNAVWERSLKHDLPGVAHGETEPSWGLGWRRQNSKKVKSRATEMFTWRP